MSAGIKGWPINLRAVYGSRWKNRERFHLREDLWVSPNGNIAAMLYDIAEVGVSKEVGRLAVFRGKDSPELVLNLPQLVCWYLYDSGVQFGKDGLLFVHRFQSGRGFLHVGLTAVDTAARRYALIAWLPENFYSVRHLDGMKYGFTEASADSTAETAIDLKDIPWKNLMRSIFMPAFP